jgi:F0F1-type ATP synthase gamma subunit
MFSQNNYQAFYTPDLTLLSDECIDELYVIYDSFVNEYSSQFHTCPDFDYFLAFAIFHDPAKETHQRHIPRELIFKYKKYPEYQIDHEIIMQMYEQLIAVARSQFFATLTSESFMQFIAPFMEVVDDENQNDDHDNDGMHNDNYDPTIIIMPNAYDLYDSSMTNF